MTEPASLVALAIVIAVAAVHLSVIPSNPPGFYRDEASIATNAWSVAQTGRDQYGALLPLYFRAFDEFKNPEFIYALAAVFRVTGPSQTAARGLSGAFVYLALALLALLAYRVSSSVAVALATLVLGGLTPWLFEVGRMAFELVTEPAALVALFLVIERTARTGTWSARRGVLAGLGLAAVVYSYSGARLYGVLLAIALPVAVGFGRRRFVLGAWASFGALMLPVAVFGLRHPGALSARLKDASFVRPEQSFLDIVGEAFGNWLEEMNLVTWAVEGDPLARHHVQGWGSIPFALVALAVGGAVIAGARARHDPFWRYVLLATVAAPVPAALTVSRFHSLRMLPLVVCLLVLAIPAVDLLVRRARARERLAVACAGVLVLAFATTVIGFGTAYVTTGTERGGYFDDVVPSLVDQALAADGRLYIAPDDLVPLAHGRWQLELRGRSSDMVVIPSGERPPEGVLVLGSSNYCSFPCQKVGEGSGIWLARALP